MYIIVYLYIRYTFILYVYVHTICIYIILLHYYIIHIYIYIHYYIIYIYTSYIYSWDDPLHHVPCPFPKTAPQAQWLDGWQATHVARSAAALGLSPGGFQAAGPGISITGKPWEKGWFHQETWWFNPSKCWLNMIESSKMLGNSNIKCFFWWYDGEIMGKSEMWLEGWLMLINTRWNSKMAGTCSDMHQNMGIDLCIYIYYVYYVYVYIYTYTHKQGMLLTWLLAALHSL